MVGHRRLVHPLRGDVQAPRAGRPLLGIRFAWRSCCSRSSPASSARNTRAACTRRARMRSRSSRVAASVEGHHEDFRRQQLAAEAGCALAVAEHQAQVQRGDGEGLAGAGAGLDQPAAAQRETSASGRWSWVIGLMLRPLLEFFDALPRAVPGRGPGSRPGSRRRRRARRVGVLGRARGLALLSTCAAALVAALVGFAGRSGRPLLVLGRQPGDGGVQRHRQRRVQPGDVAFQPETQDALSPLGIDGGEAQRDVLAD